MSSEHKKWKTEYFFGEVFLRVWKISRPKSRNEKHFLWEKTANCSSAQLFCCVGKSAEFFAQCSTKRSQVPREKNWVSRKNKNVLFHILKVLLKTLLKTFLPTLAELSQQFIKSLFFWEKEPKDLLDRKSEKLRTFPAKNCLKSEIFLLEVHE